MSKAVVISGVAVAPGEVSCGVMAPAGDGQIMTLMETRKTALPPVSEVLGKCYPYLQPNVEIPSCPVIGKGPNDHCKHGIGNLDYCPHCEHEDDDLTFADMEI